MRPPRRRRPEEASTTRLLAIVALFATLAGCTHAHESTPVATQTVVIPGPWVFQPAVAEMTAGVPVVFRNDGGGAHTVTFDGVALDEHLDPGEEFRHIFTEPGTYSYVCKLHPPDMKGTIIVTEER